MASTGRLVIFAVVAVMGLVTLPAVAGSAPEAATAGNRFAVVIGINAYEGMGDLRTCRADAKAVARVLVERAGFAPEFVILMTDDAADAKDRPTLGRMGRRIEQVCRLAQPGDTVLVFFSGHGVAVRDQGYLVPMDGDRTNAIALAEIKGHLVGSKAGSKVLILDACHAGSGVKGVGGIAPSLAAKAKNLVMLLSCAADQVSYEEKGTPHSVFTGQLLAGLSGKADADKDKRITQVELFDYVRSRMARWCLKTTKTQMPVLLGETVRPLVLARVSQMQAWRHPSTTPTAKAPSWAKVSEFQIREARKASVPVAKEVDLGGGVTMRFVYIPPGTFLMGSGMSPEEVVQRYGGKTEYFEDETQHRVTLTKGFYLGVTEVTQAQWRAVMGSEPWSGQTYAKSGDENAADYISWDDASAFCQALSRKAGAKVRLPTEAEWEYACRAGSETAYSFGDSAKSLGEYAWYQDNAWEEDEKYAHPVGRKKPNAWGLYDMQGNVWEWCRDWYAKSYGSGQASNPTGPTSGEFRVLRGGSFHNGGWCCYSAVRYRVPPVLRIFSLGFRVVVWCGSGVD